MAQKDININDIIKGVQQYLPSLDTERIIHAYKFAEKAHEGQLRASGEPYIQHPLEVANILLELKPDEDSLMVCLLHDVLEDTDTNIEDIDKEFGENIIPLLEGMRKLSKVYYRGEERQVENLRKMFLAMAQDIRVILVKLADRLHNMRTLQHISTNKRKRIAEETLTVYSPIAARLGIYNMKRELDDLCFKYLYPNKYTHIVEEMREATGLQHDIIKNSKRILVNNLKKVGIEAVIEGRIKHFYSIFKKLKRKGKNYISELYDVLALRIIVQNEEQCYRVLGIVHKTWTPLSRRFKDYIAVPKNNGYQSLHTTLIGLCPKLHNQPIELQIRTHEMNRIANYGIAAHWQYKEKDGQSIVVPPDKLMWVQNLVNLHETLQSNTEFVESLNVDIFRDRIFVLTPKGDVFDLPNNATPVDFAYTVHTEIGHYCIGAKVNGKIVPLDYQLKNGQVIEILTKNTAKPNRYWLSFVITSYAKQRIKQWFNSQDREKLIRLGKEIFNTHLKRFNQPHLNPTLNILKKYKAKKLSIRERENLLESIGNGSMDVMKVIKNVLPADKVMKKHTRTAITKQVLVEGVTFEEKPEILITGEKGYKTHIASCCHPKPTNNIIGYITRGYGITIHNQSCKVLDGLDSARLIKASWSTQKEHGFIVKLALERRSRIGLLRDIAEIFANNRLPILDIENICYEGSDLGKMIITFGLDSLETLNLIIEKLESISGIFDVKEID